MNAPSLASTDIASSLLLFVLSAGVATLAIKLYALLRTGRMGGSWRVLIIASVLYTLLQVVRLGEVTLPTFATLRLSNIVELCFVLALGYAFYAQRRVFDETPHERQILKRRRSDFIDEDNEPVVSAYESEI